MIKITPHKITILMGLLLSPSVFATDVNVDFTATVKATTCNITLTGTNVTDNGNDKYTLVIPSMGMDKIANKTAQSEANFKLVANGCSSGISWIDTTLTGNQSGSSPALIIPWPVIQPPLQAISEWDLKESDLRRYISETQ